MSLLILLLFVCLCSLLLPKANPSIVQLHFVQSSECLHCTWSRWQAVMGIVTLLQKQFPERGQVYSRVAHRHAATAASRCHCCSWASSAEGCESCFWDQVSMWDYLEYEVIWGLAARISPENTCWRSYVYFYTVLLICIVFLNVFIASVEVEGWSQWPMRSCQCLFDSRLYVVQCIQPCEYYYCPWNS